MRVTLFPVPMRLHLQSLNRRLSGRGQMPLISTAVATVTGR